MRRRPHHSMEREAVSSAGQSVAILGSSGISGIRDRIDGPECLDCSKLQELRSQARRETRQQRATRSPFVPVQRPLVPVSALYPARLSAVRESGDCNSVSTCLEGRYHFDTGTNGSEPAQTGSRLEEFRTFFGKSPRKSTMNPILTPLAELPGGRRTIRIAFPAEATVSTVLAVASHPPPARRSGRGGPTTHPPFVPVPVRWCLYQNWYEASRAFHQPPDPDELQPAHEPERPCGDHS